MKKNDKKRKVRLDGIDTARGIAIALMYLSHIVKSVMSFKMMPAFAIVPMHLITKFSSSLFILVFGVTVAVVYLPKVGTPDWPKARWKLVRRAILVMFWYKVLIVVQMFQRSPQQAIVEVLLWKRFPDFVEILQFYAWFLLLLPLLLPIWKSMWVTGRSMFVLAFGFSAYYLQGHFDFWGIWQLQAVIVEHPKAFCFGILTRGTMALGGLLLADILTWGKNKQTQLYILAGVTALLGAASLTFFYFNFRPDIDAILLNLAKNAGKHPPDLIFLSFTFGGAMLILAACLVAPGFVNVLLWPFKMMGRESLFCFNYHIILIFVGYRYLLGLRHQTTYPEAIGLTLIGVVSSVLLAWGYNSIKTAYRARDRKPEPKIVQEDSNEPARLVHEHYDDRQFFDKTIADDPDLAGGASIRNRSTVKGV